MRTHLAPGAAPSSEAETQAGREGAKASVLGPRRPDELPALPSRLADVKPYAAEA